MLQEDRSLRVDVPAF